MLRHSWSPQAKACAAAGAAILAGGAWLGVLKPSGERADRDRRPTPVTTTYTPPEVGPSTTVETTASTSTTTPETSTTSPERGLEVRPLTADQKQAMVDVYSGLDEYRNSMKSVGNFSLGADHFTIVTLEDTDKPTVPVARLQQTARVFQTVAAKRQAVSLDWRLPSGKVVPVRGTIVPTTQKEHFIVYAGQTDMTKLAGGEPGVSRAISSESSPDLPGNTIVSMLNDTPGTYQELAEDSIEGQVLINDSLNATEIFNQLARFEFTGQTKTLLDQEPLPDELTGLPGPYAIATQNARRAFQEKFCNEYGSEAAAAARKISNPQARQWMQQRGVLAQYGLDWGIRLEPSPMTAPEYAQLGA